MEKKKKTNYEIFQNKDSVIVDTLYNVTWEQVQVEMKKYSGVSARKVSALKNSKVQEKKEVSIYIDDNTIHAFTDGSYLQTINSDICGWGFVIVSNNEVIFENGGIINDKELVLQNQVGGEMKAAIEATLWAIKHNRNIIIRYDLNGVRCWAEGTWKCKNAYSKKYHEFMNKFFKTGLIAFEHVGTAGHHSGFNQRAEDLAQDAIKNYTHHLNNKIYSLLDDNFI